MNNSWLALLKTGDLLCHVCGIVILSKKDLTGDHHPVAKSKGGYDRLPSHRWCDNAHKDKIDAKNPKYLERLITSWNNNGTMFSRGAYKSVYKLQRDLIVERPLNDGEIRRSVNFLFDIPEEHRSREWANQLKLYMELMRGTLEEFRELIVRDMMIR